MLENRDAGSPQEHLYNSSPPTAYHKTTVGFAILKLVLAFLFLFLHPVEVFLRTPPTALLTAAKQKQN